MLSHARGAVWQGTPASQLDQVSCMISKISCKDSREEQEPKHSDARKEVHVTEYQELRARKLGHGAGGSTSRTGIHQDGSKIPRQNA